ncbi:hypothetical protein KJ785_00465 [Patescibacteria group bacterium]|nr:hypothetical protein [Patescibacteria group bacterium]
MTKIAKENLIKNLLIILLLIIFYFPIKNCLLVSNLVTDTASAGDILVATSILAVIACFGNFAFTYEKIKINNNFEKYLAHVTTGLLMLVIGISLILTSILTSFIMGHFFVIDLVLIMLYIACIGYDYLDVFKV